jgi:glutathione synthase/RimK-type ligase-like ATP-grasp enzyme
MSQLRILGVYRETSLGAKITSDRLIAESVQKELLARKHSVSLVETFDEYHSEDIVFSLSRNVPTLDKLSSLVEKGITVINPPDSIKICINRTLLFKKFLENNVPVPRTKFVQIKDSFDRTTFPFYLKDGDNHFGKADEKFFIQNEHDLTTVLNHLQEKGVKNVLMQESISGREIKFYGVDNTILFPKTNILFTKVELERAKNIAQQASKAVGTSIFGGDIILANSHGTLIDFNEWPSFSPVREAGAHEIANLIEQKAFLLQPGILQG